MDNKRVSIYCTGNSNVSFEKYFSPGPVSLPKKIRERIQNEIWNTFGNGLSVMEISHRSPEYGKMNDETLALIRSVFAVPDSHEILYTAMGAQHHFSLLVQHLSRKNDRVGYADTGLWASLAVAEAKSLQRNVDVVYNGNPDYKTLGELNKWGAAAGSAYTHVTVNNTVYGTEFDKIPSHFESPLVLDMTSSLAARQDIPWAQTGLIYASAQKNFGISGICVLIIRKDLLEKSDALAKENGLGNALNYMSNFKAKSILNTPPNFPIYVMNRTIQWIQSEGGVAEMEKRAKDRAQAIYGTIDEGFYEGRCAKKDRSRHNFVFKLPTEALDNLFLEEAAKEGFREIKGYRNVGGIRVSMYNTIPVESARSFSSFMKEFRRKHG